MPKDNPKSTNQWAFADFRPGPSEEQEEKLVASAAQGYSISGCAAEAGVSRATLQDWLHKGRRGRRILEEGGTVDSNTMIFATLTERFEIAQAKGVRHLEDVSTKRAEAGLGTWSEAITKLERTHRDEFGKFADPGVLSGQIKLVIEGRPPRELERDEEGHGEELRAADPRALPPASSSAGVP